MIVPQEIQNIDRGYNELKTIIDINALDIKKFKQKSQKIAIYKLTQKYTDKKLSNFCCRKSMYRFPKYSVKGQVGATEYTVKV